MFSLWLRTVGKEEGFFFLFYRAGMIFEKMLAKTSHSNAMAPTQQQRRHAEK